MSIYAQNMMLMSDSFRNACYNCWIFFRTVNKREINSLSCMSLQNMSIDSTFSKAFAFLPKMKYLI